MSQNASTRLARIGLSVRAMHVCETLECETIGELATIFQLKGADFVLGRRNCGKKTLAELCIVVEKFIGGPRDPEFAYTWENTPSCKVDNLTPEALLESIERLQISYGLPIELIKLPTRIRNWCKSHEWNTLGQLLQNAGGMSLHNLLSVDNIGRKSAAEVLEFFDALRTRRPADLRKFLPLAPNSTFISFPEAFNDLVASLNPRDLRMLQMRLIERKTLETIASNFKFTRELVRQAEDRFLRDVTRVLDWFSDQRIGLWQAWETTDDLTSSLSEIGVTVNPLLIAKAISIVFDTTPEGKLLKEHWQETFRDWGRELMLPEDRLAEGLDLVDFAKFKGAENLVSRFGSWLEQNFGDGLSIAERWVTRIPKKLTADQNLLLYGWERQELRWRSLYERLKQYCVDHGDVNVPSGWKADRQLGAWVSSQRERRKKGVMSDEEFALLEELGFTWKHRDVGTWEDRLAEVAAFKASHGHCDIPTTFSENPKLGGFVNAMRTQKNRGTLSAERIAKLNAIGFAWTSGRKMGVKIGEQIVNETWKIRFDELLAYKHAHGDCDIPAKWKQNPPLANWVSMQRQLKKRDLLPELRVKLLEEIGFNWRADYERQSWNIRYADLMKFKELHGHCDVPVRYSGNPALGAWVVRQRRNRKNGRLTIEQERRLNDAGFLWQVRTAKTSWDTRYEELLQFREKYGRCDVPVRNPENPSLGCWVASQRINRKRGKLSSDQETKLTEAGFIWQVGTAQKSWEARYSELLEFREAHGNCNVPSHHSDNSALGFWVAAQRTNMRMGRLSSEQIRLLDDAGFVWRVRAAAAD